MSPQVPGFNHGVWNRLESKVREWAVKIEEVYVVTGPILVSGLKTIGKSKVSVPNAFYKVILDVKSNEKKGIGFILENKGSSQFLDNFAVTIDSVEALTKLDFFTALDDSLEKVLEANLDKSLWFSGTCNLKLKLTARGD